MTSISEEPIAAVAAFRQLRPVGEYVEQGREDDAIPPVLLPPDPLVSAVPVSVVIPALNEARNLPHVFERMPIDVAEVIVVDGHSTDDTVDVARALWPDYTLSLHDALPI